MARQSLGVVNLLLYSVAFVQSVNDFFVVLLQAWIDLIADDDIGVNDGLLAAVVPEQEAHPAIPRNKVVCDGGLGVPFTDDSVVAVLVQVIALDLRLWGHQDNCILVAREIISEYSQLARPDQIQSSPGAVSDEVIDNGRVVTVFPAHGNVCLDVVANLILFNNAVAALHDQYAFLLIFIDFVPDHVRKRLLFDLHPGFSVEADQVVVGDLAAVVVALDQNAVQPVANDGHVLGNRGLAEETFVGFAENAVVFVLLDFVQDNRRESAVDFDALRVLDYDVATDVRLTGQTHFDPHFVAADRVAQYL